MSRIRVRVDLL